MARPLKQTELHVGPQGRVVIPASLRKALGLARGNTLIARVENDQLVLQKPSNLLARLKSRFSVVPDKVNLADELIAQRRREARKEGK
jgi:AbrB family looped-hinge helix DNA binding protein